MLPDSASSIFEVSPIEIISTGDCDAVEREYTLILIKGSEYTDAGET
jgi:hypothetical protein